MTARRPFPIARAATISHGVFLMLAASILVVASRAASAYEGADVRVSLEPVASGFEQPLFVTGAGDGSGALYVVEQAGTIRRVHPDGRVDPEPWLDLRDRVLADNERGMLGLAFHPDYAENRRYYVTYSRRPDSATVLHEFGGPEVEVEGAGSHGGPPRSTERHGRTLLLLPQPATWHKGGMLAFDTTGMLVMSTGDGGGDGDPFQTAQDLGSLLGKVLRLDVDRGWPYSLPRDNGFADVPGARPEIHAIGFRNPWRFSIDPLSGAIVVGDVGTSRWEEIDVIPLGTSASSYGWSSMEGPECAADRTCEPTDHVLPALAYVRDDLPGCAVIGGYIYRGERHPALQGRYLFADYCSLTIWSVDAEALLAGDTTLEVAGQLGEGLGLIQSFGRDDDGEIYLVTNEGHVFRIDVDPSI